MTSTLKKIQRVNYEKAVSVIESIMNQDGFGPEYVYQNPNPEHPKRCYNVWQGKGSCIVGRALLEMGVPLEWLNCGARSAMAFSTIRRDLAVAGILEFTPKAFWFLHAVQGEQDNGTNWGKAIERAKTRAASWDTLLDD